MSPTEPHETASPFDDGGLYDELFRDFTYGLDFYLQLAQKAKGPVLDMACGTGRILLPCLEAGVDVDGMDLFQPMLDRLSEKATRIHRAPTLYRSDMSDFDLPRRYALIMIPFNAFVHNLTQATQIRCLELCRKHLVPDGILAFDTFFPGPQFICATQNTRVLELERQDAETGIWMRLYDSRRFHYVDQIQYSKMDIEWQTAAGTPVSSRRSETAVRWIYKSEMELLLRVAGFACWDIHGDFDRRPLTQETDSMIVVARRTAAA